MTNRRDRAASGPDSTAQMMHNPQMPLTFPERIQAFEAIPETVRDLVNHELFWVLPPKS